RALRRRASHVVRSLEDDAKTLEQEEEKLQEAETRRAKACALAAARLERDAEENAQKLAGYLQSFYEAWRKDLEVLVTGDKNKGALDLGLARYSVERAVVHLVQPLASSLANVLGDSGTTAADWVPTTRTAVRSWAGAPAADLLSLVRAVITTAIETLNARSVFLPVLMSSTNIQQK